MDNNIELYQTEPVRTILLRYMTEQTLEYFINHPADRLAKDRICHLVSSAPTIAMLLNYYSQQDVCAYLDAWMGSAQYIALPDEYFVKGLFDGYEKEGDIIFTELDLCDGAGHVYPCFPIRQAEMLYHRSNMSAHYPYDIENEWQKALLMIPSRSKVIIPIEVFTQMAVNEAIEQGFTKNAGSINHFFIAWRANIDYQEYYQSSVNDIAPKDLLSSNAQYRHMYVSVIKQKVKDAYRTKKEFYESELEKYRLPVPYPISPGITVQIASEDDVINLVDEYLADHMSRQRALWNIWNMMRRNTIPFSLINERGVIYTRFYDISALTGGDSEAVQFKSNGKTYTCAFCDGNPYKVRIYRDSIHGDYTPWHLPFWEWTGYSWTLGEWENDALVDREKILMGQYFYTNLEYSIWKEAERNGLYDDNTHKCKYKP